jgi:hypothetical protein
MRSRAGSSASRYNDPLSPERVNPLEGIQEILEMHMNTTYDNLARRGSGDSITEAEDEEDSTSRATGIITESQNSGYTQESGPDINHEQDLKREIFSIHEALANSHDDTMLSYFPQTTTTPLHIDLSLSDFQPKALGTVQSRNASSVTLTLTLSLSDSLRGLCQDKPPIPFSFSDLRPGDTVTLINDLADRNTNTNTSTSTNAPATQQQHQYANEKTVTTITGGIPPPSYHIATTTRAAARELSINSQSFCLNTSIPLYIYVLSLMLMLAFPPTTYFFLHHLASTSSSISSTSPSTITFLFMILLTLNAFVIGVLYWITGTCLVLLMRLRESPRWKSGGEREKNEGAERGEKEQMSKLKDTVYRLLQLKYEAEFEYESEFEPEAISPTMNWIFGAVIAGLWCVSWYVPWVMSMMEWAEY